MKIIDSFRGQYRFLSNFYGCAVEYEGMLYPTTEHAYQAAKSTNPIQRAIFQTIPQERPNEAKQLGGIIERREDFDNVRKQVMLDLQRLKYAQKDFKEKLLATGDAILIEGNHWHDNFWGNCICRRCEDIEGQNNLGLAIMQVRDELRKANE